MLIARSKYDFVRNQANRLKTDIGENSVNESELIQLTLKWMRVSYSFTHKTVTKRRINNK